MVDLPAFALQQDMQTAVSVANPRSGQITQPDFQSGLISGSALVVGRCPIEAYQLARPSQCDFEADTQKLNEFLFLGRPQSFFAITS